MMYGFLDVIIPNNDNMFAKSSHNVNLLFPKYFRILELLESNNKVASEDNVYSIPTNFSETIPERNVEFTYAESAMCRVNKNDKIYILLIFVNFIFLFLLIHN